MIFLARLDGRNLAPLFFSIFFVNVVQCAGMGSNLELSKEAEVSRVLQEGISIAKTSKTEKVLAQCSLPNDKKVGINAGSKLKRKLNSQGQPSGARKHKFLQEDASHLLEPRPSNDEVMKDMNINALSEIFLIRKMVEESRNNVNSVGNSKPSRKLEGLLESFKIRLSAKIPSKQASLGNELDVDKRSLFFEEIEIPLVEMFESIFKSSHESYEKVNRISDNIEIKLVLELLNFIADIKLGKNRLMHNLLKNEINLRGLVWYITTQFIEKWGLMGIFQTADIRKFLLEHEDLSNIRSLLKILENEHWKAIEIGFIRDHIVNSLSKLGKELYLVNLRSLKIYEQILSAIEVAHSFDPEWLKFLDLDASMIDNFSGFFCRNIFAYHTLKCIKSHFNNVDLGGILNNQINYFGEIVTMNAKLLRFNEALINRKFVKEIINFNDQFDTLSFLRPSGVLDKGPEFRKNDLQPNLLTFVFNSNGDFDCATLWTIEVTREEKALTSQFDHFFSFMNRPPEKILNWLSTAKVQQFFTSIVLTKKYFTNIVNEVNTANAKGVSEIHLTVN